MSRNSDGYFGRGSRKRTNQGYSNYRQRGDSYGGARSSQEYRSGGVRSQGRGLMVNPWEGGVVPGSGGVAGRAMQGSGATPQIVASINQLSRMDNPESELALNILSAVLTNKEESQWDRQRGWESGHKRKMDWDDQYYGSGSGSGRGILPTPQVPPRKVQKRNAAKFSWGVVGPFVPGWPGRGRGGASGSGYKFKKAAPAKKKTVAAGKTAGKTFKGKGDAKNKPAVKGSRPGENKTKPAVKTSKPRENKPKAAPKIDGELKAEEAVEEARVEGKTEDVAAKTDGKEGTAEGQATAEGETPATKTSTGETEPKKKELEPRKKKEECPVPLSYLRCHICHMHKFNNGSNFMDHVRSKKHRRMSLHYKEKMESTSKMLKAQSWLKSQRHIVSMVKQKGRITKCETCDCPIKGGQGPHLHLREHALVYHFTKCFTCKKKFTSRAELEAHKLSFAHMRVQCDQDNIARDRLIHRIKKQARETIIPEQKLTEEFHEMVTQMQLNNISSQVWYKDSIPAYDPALPIGLNHLVKQSLFVCSVCPKKVSHTAHEALEHSKTREHYNYYRAQLKALEEKEEKGETPGKEDETEDSTVKKVEVKKLEIKKDAEEENAIKKEDKPKIKEEKDGEEIEKEQDAIVKEEEEMDKEEEEIEKERQQMEKEEEEIQEVEKEEEELDKDKEEENDQEEQEDDDGMKDMENMEVIDEEGEQEEEDVEDVSKDIQEEHQMEGEDGDALVSVEEVGEDLEEDVTLDDEIEEMVKTDDKTTTSSATEDKTGTSASQKQPEVKSSPTPKPVSALDALSTALAKPQTRQGRGRARGRDGKRSSYGRRM